MCRRTEHLVEVNSNAFFTLRNQPRPRGRKTSAVLIELEEVFFSNRVVNLWTNLPVCTHFTSLGSLNNDYLLKYRPILMSQMNVDCSLTSCYLAKKLKKEESVLKVKSLTVIVCCTILTYVQNYANVVSNQYS